MTDQEVYDGSSIEVLEGLEPVRRRPGMYTDTQNPNHLAMEVIDNSVDEALAGFAHLITVTLHADNSIEVTDDGRGMPVDPHPVEKVPAIELILTRLHAGGKFSGDSYRFSGGLHGVGVSVVNALSSRLEARVRRDGHRYFIAYEQGEKVEGLRDEGTCPRAEFGTTVRFWPDGRYFDEDLFNPELLRHDLKAKALLCEGLTVAFCNELDGSSERWSYGGGLGSYLGDACAGRATEPPRPFECQVEGEDFELSFAVAWELEGRGDQGLHESYVNLIPTPDGGTHVNGLRTGLLLAIREFCEIHNLLPRDLRLTPEDVWGRCSHVLALMIRDPQFAGQTKGKLSNREVASLVEGAVRDRFSLFLNSDVAAGKALAGVIIESAKERESSAKKVSRKKVGRGPALPGKLTDCSSTDPARGELFIVEGDSAGGSARQARDSSYQAILPLRGKILNTWEISGPKALTSEEIKAISVAIGLEPDREDLEGLRYHKICILADADVDGLHIGTLLCALFVRHFPSLVRAGHVFVACPPLYRLDCGKVKDYALDDEELERKRRDLVRRGHRKDSIRIQRFKGLGEMNPEQLGETTMDPKSRRLMQLTLGTEGDEPTMELMDLLLSKKRASDRRDWLERNGARAEDLS